MDFDDLFSEPAAPTTRAGGRFRPKSKPHLKKVATGSSAQQIPDAQSSYDAVEALVHEDADKGSADPKDENLDKRVSNNAETIQSPDNTGFQASETYRDSPVTGNDAEFQDAATSFDLETLDIISEGPATYGHLTGKFKLKPKFKDTMHTGRDTSLVEEGPDPASQAFDATNHAATVSSMVPPDATAENFPVNTGGEETSYMDTASFLDFVDFEDVPETNEEPSSKSEKGKAAASTADEPVVSPVEYTSFEEENGPLEDSQHESVPEKPKRAGQENEKPVQKRRKKQEISDKPTKEPQKRFSHSTRRKRRPLDKELLETPDEEIRYLPIKDMLRLTDYKDWLEKQDAKALGTPAKESVENTSHNHNSQNEDPFASESSDVQDGINCETASFVLNYHSYTNREPKLKWSKQDTELFYEGIRQFGTDLSMIQQLFPKRSRHQMKLKYKKEERQQPMRLHEALTNRAKNFSHFELVIKKLEEEAAQLAREAKEEGEEEEDEETANMSGEEPEIDGNPKTEDAAKSEAAAVAEEMEDPEADHDVAESYDNEEEDDDIWSSYRSEL